jgi:hypothetical protein
MSWLSRYASKVVQKAHARVTAENARYVREAIERDAEVERLTQERNTLREQLADANARLALIDREEDTRDEVRAKRAGDQ